MKKILHIGLCVNPNGFSSFPYAFKQVLGEENYAEIQTASDHGFNKRCVDLFDSFKPDIVFMQIQAEGIISAQACQHFKSNGAFVINWTGDKRHDVPKWMINLAPFVSLTSFSNMDDVRKMRELGWPSEYLEIGYDPEIYCPEGPVTPAPDIVFMGNNYGHGHFPMSSFRIEMVEFLQREYGSRFGVYGTGWNNPAGNVNHSQHEEASVYRGAKVAINLSHFDCERYNSDRLLRILGCGLPCVSYTHEGMHNSMASFFFEDLSELKDYIDAILLWDNEAIKEEGALLNKVACSEFTFAHQVQNILKLAECAS